MKREYMNIDIDRKKVAKYWTIVYLGVGIAAYGVGVVVSIIAIVWGIPMKQSNELKYWIEEDCVRINQGLFFKKQKTIPFNKITDVMWHQGPVMRRFGLEGLRFQTAGSPQPEGTMIGVRNAQEVRDSIMSLIKASRTR
jgi:membrane protein YdbS with pleckstrin-like domain